MEKNNDLISVIEDLLEADMTGPKKVKNPQNKMAEEDQVSEAQDKTDKSIAANKLTSTANPTADNQSAKAEADKEVTAGAGPSVDTGAKNKGEISSDAADNSKEVLGSTKGAALDGGGDKDVGKIGSKEKGNPSDASAEVEADKGPHDQSKDESVELTDDESIEEGQDTSIEKNANDDQLPDEEKESMKNMKEGSDMDDDSDDDEDDDKEMDESMEWDWDAIDNLSEEDFNELVGELSEEELVEFNSRFESLVEDEEASDEDAINEDAIDEDAEEEVAEEVEEVAEAKMIPVTEGDEEDDDDSDDDKEMDEAMDPVGKEDDDIDNDGDTDSSDGYLRMRRKAIKAAMSKEETEVEEATGETLEKPSTKSHNEPMRPAQEKGDNAPESKGGNPGEGPHDQSKDPNETSTKANPKGAVKEDLDDISQDLDESFKEKAKVIFETAVNEKANVIKEELEAQYEEKLGEQMDSLNEKLNDYMDYAVKEWLEENQLEIKYSLRTEIAENFIREMKGVFETNFIDIPEEEVSVVDELTEAVESYKEQLSEQADELEAAKKDLLNIKRKEIVEQVGNDLPQTQKIRLEKLSESVEADEIDEFRYKIEQLKEGYFDESSEQPLLSSLSEEVFGGNVIEEDDDNSVTQYAKFLSKTVTK